MNCLTFHDANHLFALDHSIEKMGSTCEHYMCDVSLSRIRTELKEVIGTLQMILDIVLD